MRGNTDKIRTSEQLNDLERMLKGIHFACRTAITCLAARPRTWRKYAIIQESVSIWESNEENRVIQCLFAENEAKCAMAKLSTAVRFFEDAEIKRATPVCDLVDAISRQVTERIENLLTGTPVVSALPPAAAPMPTVIPTQRGGPPPQQTCIPPPLVGLRKRHKRVSQQDVSFFSSFSSVSCALDYATRILVPKEQEFGASWRIIKREDGREDKSRDKQWRNYKTLALAIGVLMNDGATRSSAISQVQRRFDDVGGPSKFLRAINSEKPPIVDAERLTALVLGIV